MATWTIEDPIVVNSVKTAKILGYMQELDPFDLSECSVDRGPDLANPERLELWIMDQSAAAFLARLDIFALRILMSNAQRFFDEPLNPMQVLERYKPALETLGGELPLLVARLGVEAPCREIKRGPRGRPPSWEGLVVNPRFDISSLWFTDDAWGLTVEVLELDYDVRNYWF